MKILSFLLVQTFLIANIAQADFSRDVPDKMPVSHFSNRKFRKPVIDNIVISNINSTSRRSSEEKVLVRQKRGIIGTGVKVASKVLPKHAKDYLKGLVIFIIGRIVDDSASEWKEKHGISFSFQTLYRLFFGKNNETPDLEENGNVWTLHNFDDGFQVGVEYNPYENEIFMYEFQDNKYVNAEVFKTNDKDSLRKLIEKYRDRFSFDAPDYFDEKKIYDFLALDEDLKYICYIED